MRGADMVERFDWRIADVVSATGLGYEVIRRALLSGALEGIASPRLLRTNEAAVERWLDGLRVKPIKATPSPAQQRPTHKGKGQAFIHLDPSTFGRR
jgi:hypothetical protein